MGMVNPAEFTFFKSQTEYSGIPVGILPAQECEILPWAGIAWNQSSSILLATNTPLL